MSTTSPDPTLEKLVNDVRILIEVSDPELAEARKRRNAIGTALRRAFPGSRIYVNGSIAHGDALTPLTDVDVGVVVPDSKKEYGPGKRGPQDLKERAAQAIRAELKEEYGDLAVEVKGRKRSILVRFRDPVAPGRPDFTADVIVAIDNPDGAGLYIPRHNIWDRSHPEKHTQLIHLANEESGSCFARVVRLLKQWNRHHSKPLCSWNIKALALECIDEPTLLISGLRTWFEHAIKQLSNGETPDPADVAKNPIKLNTTRTETIRLLKRALATLELAIAFEDDGYTVLMHNELAKFFNDSDVLPAPDPGAVDVEEARRVTAKKKEHTTILGTPALLTGTGAFAGHERGNVRSWGA